MRIIRVNDSPVEIRSEVLHVKRKAGVDIWVEAVIANGLLVDEFLLSGKRANPAECKFAENVPAKVNVVTSRLPHPWDYVSIAFQAAKQKVDVLHACLPSPAAALSVIFPGCAKIKVTFLVGDPEHTLGIKYGVLGSFIGKVCDCLTRIAIRKADIAVFVSHALKEKYGKGKEKVLTVPDAKYFKKDVRTPEFCPVHQPPRVMFAGRLSAEKGLDVLMEALEPEWELWVAGSGQLEEEVSARGKYFGWVSPDRLRELMRQVDVVVVPSYTEGLPNIILDAIMNGIPVVGSSVGGIPEVLRNGRAGALVAPGQPNDLREAIRKILYEDKYRRKIIAEAHDVACAYACDVSIKPLVDAIKELL